MLVVCQSSNDGVPCLRPLGVGMLTRYRVKACHPSIDHGQTTRGKTRGAKKDTRGGGIGCRALRLLRERFSLAGMQILAGTPPRVWAFACYFVVRKFSAARRRWFNSTLEFFGRCPWQ